LQGPADADEMADELILAAAHADCEGFDHATHLPSLIEILAQGMGLEGGRDLVAGRLGIDVPPSGVEAGGPPL
jgi:hypothetical protein